MPDQKIIPRHWNYPLLFVIISLLALAVIPLWGERYVASVEDELEQVVEPARTLVTQVHLALAKEGRAIRDLLHTDDSRFLARYQQSMIHEQSAYEQLGAFVPELGGTVQSRFSALRRAESAWHSRLQQLLASRPMNADSIELILSDENFYEETLLAAAQLDEALTEAARGMRKQIDRADRLVLYLTLFLVVIAMAAGAVVAKLGSRLRRYAIEAEQGRRKLEAVIESKSRMSRGITHDLKNPLGAILGHAGLLADGIRGPLQKEQQDGVARIQNSAESMLELIEALLELASADSGELQILRVDVDLTNLVRDVAETHRAALEKAGLSLELQLEPGVRVETDAARVKQVLENLLTNARKYTPSGCVTVSLKKDATLRPGAVDGGATIAVIDTGPGIEPSQREHVFAEFTRLDPSVASGAGLGLAISRMIVQLLGGNLTLDSEIGRGSAFTLRLPAS